jgi:hypothetical protein
MTLPFALSDADWTAIGGISAAIATIVLAVITGRVLRQGKSRTTAMQDQVTAIRETPEGELAAFREQIKASTDANDAVRDAARKQLQPIVIAYPEAVTMEGQTRMFTYRLRNEGTGPALDIEHGFMLDDERVSAQHHIRLLSVGRDRAFARTTAYDGQAVTYFAQFSNVFGERFETLNPEDENARGSFRQLPDVDESGYLRPHT